MTAIPGTSSPKAIATTPLATPSAPRETAPLAMAVTNVEEIKKDLQKPVEDKTIKTYFEPEGWNHTLTAWMVYGTVVGILIALLGLKYSQFFYLAPLGPTAGTLSWFIKRFMSRQGKKFDVFS